MSEDAAEAEVSEANHEEAEAEAESEREGEPDRTESAAERASALADRAGDEALASDLAGLADDVAELEERAARVAELEAGLKRKQAEFENYKKRQEREREKLKERATEAFVERVVGVRDDLVRALDQDEDADLRDGLSGTLAAFDEVLAEEGVDPVEPDAGDEVDPTRHEVLMREASDQPEGTVVRCYRPGYEMADRVLQTAQVTVSEGPDDPEES